MKYSFKNTLSTDGVYLDLVSLKQGSEKKTLEKKTLFHVPAHRDGGLCIFKKFYLLFHFYCGCAGSSLPCAMCLAGATLQLRSTDFSLWGLLSLQSVGSRACVLGSCSSRA